ncbi:MAG: DUF1580 domain-containing protein [Phycisphaerales bacterium]|nr:DUF1580 domain-containing protein [Phycisphaerales bacterium]
MDEHRPITAVGDSRRDLGAVDVSETHGDGGANSPEYIELAAAARLIPGRPSTNAIWRWARRGVRARNGARIHLRHVRLGGRLLTTRLWVDQFGQTVAAADALFFDQSPDPTSDTRSDKPNVNACRARNLDRVERELDQAGI